MAEEQDDGAAALQALVAAGGGDAAAAAAALTAPGAAGAAAIPGMDPAAYAQWLQALQAQQVTAQQMYLQQIAAATAAGGAGVYLESRCVFLHSFLVSKVQLRISERQIRLLFSFVAKIRASTFSAEVCSSSGPWLALGSWACCRWAACWAPCCASCRTSACGTAWPGWPG